MKVARIRTKDLLKVAHFVSEYKFIFVFLAGLGEFKLLVNYNINLVIGSYRWSIEMSLLYIR